MCAIQTPRVRRGARRAVSPPPRPPAPAPGPCVRDVCVGQLLFVEQSVNLLNNWAVNLGFAAQEICRKLQKTFSLVCAEIPEFLLNNWAVNLGFAAGIDF